jgi:thiol-disulfide isomerase/thioredoxin
MKTLTKTFLAGAGFAALLSVSGPAVAAGASPGAAALDGHWDAVLTRGEVEIPFRLDIEGSGPTLKGVLYDGFRPNEKTTSASFEDGKLVLNIDHYLTTINATLDDGKLTGAVVAQNRESSAQYGFKAVRHVEPVAVNVNAPSIAGSYVIPLDTPSSKGEKAFRLVVEQKGADASASILRIDGDTGAYSGAYRDGKWVLSHFDGSRPGIIVVTPNADGTLAVQQRGSRPEGAAEKTAASKNAYGSEAAPDGRYAAGLTAYRQDVALAKGLPQPDDVLTHTTARDPNETFAFNFPDVNGKLISNEDPRFKGKVVLAIVTGTWCPNCHDEAQYLVQLDKKYRDKGLAIVALDFEEPEQQNGLERAKAFVKQYGVKYTYLFAGAPAEMWEKVPQLNHLDTWPATVFLGRDGKVKAVHSGFASPASAEFHDQLKKDFATRIEALLAQKAPTKAADASAPTKLAEATPLTTR